jgi:hypothetical protein
MCGEVVYGTMRTDLLICLLIVFFSTTLTATRADEVTLFAPASDATCAQLRQLDQWGMLSDDQDKVHASPNYTTLKRYDVAFMLVEPFERCIALITVQENPQALPEQHRRAEVAYFAFSKLLPIECDQVITTLTKLQLSYHTELEKLAPGLTHRAAPALQKLSLPAYRPWLEEGTKATSDDTPRIHVTIGPHSPDDPLKSRLDFLAPEQGSRSSFFTRSLPSSSSGSEIMIGSRPVSTLEAAVDVAFSGVRLYGSVGTLPGQDPATMIFRPDGIGQAMLGVEIGLTKINNLGISGIFEFHVMRYGDANSTDTDTGAVGGIGLHW